MPVPFQRCTGLGARPDCTIPPGSFLFKTVENLTVLKF